MIAAPRTLRTRMVVVFGLLIVAIAGFMAVFLPGRIEAQLRAATERRALTLGQVVASAVAPAVEFEDPDHARATLAWLDTLGDAQFAVVDNAGARIAAWHGERAPADLPTAVDQLGVHYVGELLVVSAPVVQRTAGRGALHLGFSMADLHVERDKARRTVEIASLAVLGAGALVCFVLATILVRPIRRLTEAARRIARGEAPPALAAGDGGAGGDEVGQMASALSVMLDRLNQVNIQLVDASRHAGMAEVATGVLHNVGNVLTSVNLAVGLLGERIAAAPVERMTRATALLADARATGDTARLDAAIKLVGALGERFATERAGADDELATLRRHIEHVAQVVLTQNRYAKTVAVTEAASLAAVLDEAIELGCPEAERKGIAIVREVACDGLVAIDRHRVLQVLVNLISNARDAVLAGSGPRTIRIRAERDAGTLRIAVADTGVGFAIDDGARLFQAGFTTKRHGHGYGLHSSALAAQQLGGTLRCTSRGQGQGARFSLQIPIHDQSRDPGRDPGRDQPTTTARPTTTATTRVTTEEPRMPDSSHPRILLVDDNEVLLADYLRILEPQARDAALEADLELDALEQLAGGAAPAGTSGPAQPRYELTAVNQGDAALVAVDRAMAAGRPYSVVFLDVRMPPGIDGVETAARLWRAHPDLEIVLCSAHNDYGWDDLARALGPTDHLLVLRKPFDAIEVRQLAASLSEKWLRGRRLARQIEDLDAAIQAEVEARIAERAAHEAEMRRRERLQVLGRLAAGLVHEISTPVQLASTSLEVITEVAAGLSALVAGGPAGNPAELAAELAEGVDDARLAVGRIQSLVKRYRAQVRHEPDQALRPARLEAEIRAAVTLAEAECRHDAEVVLDLAPLPPVECDAADISQAVLNLVINAAHAIREVRAGQGPLGRIAIATRLDGAAVEISVADTGTGIKPEHRDRIFEPFFTTKPIDQGTGQGLAIVHACVVERHRGSLTFDTEVGAGTTFRIRLPVAQRQN